MDLKIQRQYRICVLAAFLLLAACGSAPKPVETAESNVVEPSNYYLGNKDTYAVLISGSGGSWMFDQVTESALPPAKGYLVRLNDLAPAFDTRIAECVPQAYATSHKCSPAHPFRNKDVGVIGKIISGGLAAGTAGKVTDVSRTYKTSFDETAFNQAVDEALVNTGLNGDRQEFLSSLESYATILESSRAELNELKRQSEAQYRDTSTVKLDIQATISGLDEYYTNDLDFRELVELVPQSGRDQRVKALQEEKLLPCDARQCAQKTRNAIASIHAEIENFRSGLESSNTAGRQVYDVLCDKTSHAGYLFKLRCPSEITRAAVGGAPLPIAINILARDFDELYPNVDLDDENLSIEIEESDVLFSNSTPNFLTITAHTVYYNAQVQTNTSEIHIAPGATVRKAMSEFVSPAIDIESSYRQMTPGKAESASFQFGLATKYRVGGDAEDKTLYHRSEFNVGCTIKNRIQAGSCVESSTNQMHARKKTSPQVPF